ncbi:MAG: hypothetical protein H7099_19805 [Gemmatimonadaceae bacterium]|nr:hypothetical protein [Gemmatimonadaceae bacterium]
MIRRLSRLALAASAVIITSCSAKKEIIAPPVTAVITVTAATPTLSVAQAASGSSVITVGRTNFTGDVNLTAENLPTGVTATFTPATLASGATASSVSLTVAGTAAVTTTPVSITIRARGTGVTDATTAIALSVTATPTGAMSITATPATASITAGQATTTAIAIARTGGFTGGVTFTVTGAKTGVTTTFSSANPVTANTVNLSVSTLASVAPGPDTLVVRANATGLTEATATFIVTVAAPPSNSVTWRFCDPARIPLWFAVQDGASGTWQRITETAPSGSGVYTFSYEQPRVGVATVMNDNATVFTQVTYYGTSEVAAEALAECKDYPTPGTKTLSGSITGFANANEVGLVSMGSALSSSANSSTPAFTIAKVPDGAVDLIAVRANLVTSSVQRMLINRGTNFPAGPIGTLDLAAGTSFAPGTGSLTITAPNDGTLFGKNVFTTATGSSASFSIASLSSGVAAAYQGVPDANMIASDLQEIQVEQPVGATISRFITRYTRGPGAVTLSMPLDPAVPTITNVTGSPYRRAIASGTVATVFNDLIAVEFAQATRRWEMVTTALGRANSTTYSFTMPDFSTLAGWQTTWGLAAGSTDITSSFFGQTGANPDGTPTTGTQIVLTGRFSTFTFP